MQKTQYYLQARDVMSVVGCKQTKASQLIRQLNTELQNQGYITIEGIVPTKYFADRTNIPFEQLLHLNDSPTPTQ